MWGFDVVTEEDKGDEEVVDVGLMDREEDQGYILLLKKHTHTHKEVQRCPYLQQGKINALNSSLHFLSCVCRL